MRSSNPLLFAVTYLMFNAVVADEGSILRFKEEPPISLLVNVGEKARLRCKTNSAQEDITWFFNDVRLGSPDDSSDSRRQRRKRNKEDRLSSFKLMTNPDFEDKDFHEHNAYTNIQRRKGKRRKHKGKRDNINLFSSLRSATRYVRDLSSSTLNSNRFDFQVRSGRLLIQNFTSDAVGWYYCVATTPSGSIRSKSVHLHSPTLGNFEYAGQPVTAQVGQSTVILCVLPPSEPPAKALWKINNETWINESSAFTILHSGTLLINNVSSQMSGYRFLCYAQNPMSKEMKPALLPTVLAVSSLGAGSGPKVIFPRTANISMKATVGDSASLDCIANENSGDPSVVWDRENSHLPASATVTKTGLVFETIRPSDSGIYHCNVQGSLMKITYHLTVHEKLKVMPLSAVYVKLDAQNHTGTVLECGTSAELSILWNWCLNGEEIKDAKSNLLNINSHGNMSGFYQCFATAGKEVEYTTFQVNGGAEPAESIPESDTTDNYFKVELDKRGIKPPIITSPAHTSNHDSFELSWHIDENTEIQMKLISIKYCKDPPDTQWEVVNVPSSLDMVVLHGLEPASTYKLEMISVSQSDTRSMLALSSFSTGEIPKSNPPPNRVEPRPEKTPKQNYRDRTRIPMAPSKPTVTEISAHSISLMWYPRGNGGSPIKWYRVQSRKIGSNEEWKTIADNLPIANFPPYEITSLPRGSSFKFRVFAVNSKGDSRASSPSSPYPSKSPAKKPIPSDPPFIMNTKIQGDTSIVLKWRYDFPVSALIGYRVFYRSSDSDDEQDYINEEVRDPTATSYVIHHLRPEMQYDIKIQAFNSEYRSKFSNVVIIEMPKAGEGYHPPIRPKPDEPQVYIPGDDHNEPAREKAYHRSTMFLISGGVIAFILIILVISVFFYWRKRNSLSAQSTPDLKLKKIDSNKYSAGKAANSPKINNSMDSVPPNNSSNGHTPNQYNQSPHDTRCTCSRHHSNHSSLGRDGGDFSQYTALPYRPDPAHRIYGDNQELGRLNWEPGFTNIQVNPLHMYMDHRYPYYPPGLGGLPIRWVRGANGEFCHIVPVDTRKMGGTDGGTELCGGYPGSSGAMVMRTYDGNVGYYDETVHRPDHGYHSNDDMTKSKDDANNDKSTKVSTLTSPNLPSSDGDSNSEGIATSGVLTHSDTISSRTPSSLSPEEGLKIETEDTACGSSKQSTHSTSNSQYDDMRCQDLEITDEIPLCSQSLSHEKINENCDSIDENTNFIKSSENMTERQTKETIIS